jgi:hypothetical protein
VAWISSLDGGAVAETPSSPARCCHRVTGFGRRRGPRRGGRRSAGRVVPFIDEWTDRRAPDGDGVTGHRSSAYETPGAREPLWRWLEAAAQGRHLKLAGGIVVGYRSSDVSRIARTNVFCEAVFSLPGSQGVAICSGEATATANPKTPVHVPTHARSRTRSRRSPPCGWSCSPRSVRRSSDQCHPARQLEWPGRGGGRLRAMSTTRIGMTSRPDGGSVAAHSALLRFLDLASRRSGCGRRASSRTGRNGTGVGDRRSVLPRGLWRTPWSRGSVSHFGQAPTM